MGAPQHLEGWDEGEMEREQSLRQESKITAREDQMSRLSGTIWEDGVSPVDASERLHTEREARLPMDFSAM